MRVLHIISSGGMYGAEAVILNLSESLHRGAHASILGVFQNSAQPNLQLYEAATNRGIEAYTVPCRGQVDLAVTAQIRELARTTRADVIHTHGYKADLYSFFAMRGLRTPMISTCHTWYDNDLAVRLYGTLDRLVLRQFGAVVAVSEEVRARLQQAGVRANRIHIVHNGVDLRPFQNAWQRKAMRMDGTQMIVGLVGRLAPEKGVDLFLQAAARVLARYPNVRFVIVGDGPDRKALEATIAALGVGEHVSMAGRCDDMPAFYASLDVLVSSSRQEGLPIALLEGMASRCAIVASDVGAVPTVIQDGHTGILVHTGDIHALTEAILHLLQDPSLRERYGESAHALVEQQFSAEHMALEYLRLYEDLLEGGSAA